MGIVESKIKDQNLFELRKRLLQESINYLERNIKFWFEEDKVWDDITTRILRLGGKGRAIYFSKNKKDFVVAGVPIVKRIFEIGFEFMKDELVFKEIHFEIYKNDGDFVRGLGVEGGVVAEDSQSFESRKIFEVSGDIRLILALERLTLNILARLSGIATETKRLVEIAERFGVEVWATRKTTPGLRIFEKYAVCVGGGFPHREDLSDGVLIKDNHITLKGGIQKVMNFLVSADLSEIKTFEIEVQSKEELEIVLMYIKEILKKNPSLTFAVMLDNFSPSDVYESVKKVRDFERRENLKIYIELSGGIRPENAEDFIRAKPDRISSGYITFSPSMPDISVDVEIP